jgi:hypothetical protein
MVTNDPSLAIVFSAMAFECELSRLFFKCKEIDGLENGSQISDDDIEEELRQFSNIKNKIEKVISLLDQTGITGFVESTSELKDIIDNDFPSLKSRDLSQGFQRQLF